MVFKFPKGFYCLLIIFMKWSYFHEEGFQYTNYHLSLSLILFQLRILPNDYSIRFITEHQGYLVKFIFMLCPLTVTNYHYYFIEMEPLCSLLLTFKIIKLNFLFHRFLYCFKFVLLNESFDSYVILINFHFIKSSNLNIPQFSWTLQFFEFVKVLPTKEFFFP